MPSGRGVDVLTAFVTGGTETSGPVKSPVNSGDICREDSKVPFARGTEAF